MIVKGHIIDQQTGKGIPFASVQLVTAGGEPMGAGTVATSSGDFELNSDRIYEGGFLLFSSVSYYPIIAGVTYFINDNTIDLERLPKELEPVIVRPKSKWGILALIAGLLIAAKYSK